MPFDARLAERVRHALRGREDVAERRMFGGVCFLVRGNMCCGVARDLLVLRLGELAAQAALRRPHTRVMDFTGRPMKGMIYVTAEGLATDARLQAWLDQAVRFTLTLPPKVGK